MVSCDMAHIERSEVGAGKTVCVTGATGYMASWLIKVLLARGYTVRGTVRTTAEPEKLAHLRALEGAAERLHLFEAKLEDEASFDAAFQGCDGVFHTALPPYTADAEDPEAVMVKPAEYGTANVVRACAKNSTTIKRVLLLLSAAAMNNNGRPRNADTLIDDTWCASEDYCQQRKLWYSISKIRAEEIAWKLARENGIDLVTIHPVFAAGPLLRPALNVTSSTLLNLINGSSATYRNACAGWVNVRDVALAHALAFEDPSARGRIIVSESVVHFSEIVNIIHKNFPTLAVPEKCKDNGKPIAERYQYSQEKANKLGIQHYIPLETSIKETIESLKDMGFINF